MLLLMKRLQILIDEDVDAALDEAARRDGTSKAAVIRRLVRTALPPAIPLAADPLAQMKAADDFEPASIDDIVYG